MRTNLIRTYGLMASATVLFGGVWAAESAAALPAPDDAKTRLAIVGLDHDHVWGLLKDIAAESNTELVGIAATHPALVDRPKSRLPTTRTIYTGYVKILQATKPQAVI